ncbi:MAG: xanthine dehydrogenase family protein subunit M [Anaerolineales bacterium]
MYSAHVDYYRPTSVAEAVELLSSTPGAKLLAGGHSLIPSMKLRVAQPTALVDIGRIKELSGISVDGDSLRIGALTTHDAIATSPDVKTHCAILAEAASLIGDQQVRNRGTIGGSLAQADPATDFPTLVTVLDATLTVAGPNGTRDIPAKDFFKDLFTTALAEDEVLTMITVPVYGAGTGGAYLKMKHPASGFAVVGVAALVSIVAGKYRDVRLAVGGATANPTRISASEAALRDRAVDDANIASAIAHVSGSLVNPFGDHYASAGYRQNVAAVLSGRALKLAAERAAG